MNGETHPVVVERRDAEHRLVVERDGLLAELTYRLDGDRLDLLHDGVPAELGGRGVGSALVAAAVDWARSSGLTIVPRCPFARHWLREHPELTEGVTVDWH